MLNFLFLLLVGWYGFWVLLKFSLFFGALFMVKPLTEEAVDLIVKRTLFSKASIYLKFILSLMAYLIFKQF